MFAQRLGSENLAKRCCKLASHYNVSPDLIAGAQNFKPAVAGAVDVDEKLKAALMMGHAMGPSPAQVDSATIQQAGVLEPPEVVEVTTFLGVLQLLHRLTVWRASH